jgi:hypothetical protein
MGGIVELPEDGTSQEFHRMADKCSQTLIAGVLMIEM